jgi:hypothetical protein
LKQYTYDDVGRLDLLLLRLRAAHGLLDLDGAPDLAVDARVQEEEADVGEQLGLEPIR